MTAEKNRSTKTTASAVEAQEAPQPAAPEKEHEWLKQFAGEWEAEGECPMEPGKPPVKFKGTESVRTVGEFWIVADSKSTTMDLPYTSVLTLGYDPQKKKFVGTWLDSMSSYLWRYEGIVDATGRILTLETEGPNMAAEGKMAKFKEVTEFKSKDHKVFTSSIQGEDGQLSTVLTINFRRKK